MNRGYYVEKELMHRNDIYNHTSETNDSDGSLSQLQREVEGGYCDKTEFTKMLIKAILENLRVCVSDYAHHQCKGCRFDHPSQKHHHICLWLTPKEWVEKLRCHESALEGLNIYDVMHDWDKKIWNYVFSNRDYDHMTTMGVDLLTSEESEDVYKSWQYFKKCQRDLTDRWKTYWGKKLIETYEKNDCSKQSEFRQTQ